MEKLIYLLLLLSLSVRAESYQKLEEITRKSLETNIVTLEGKQYLRAGENHFGSLWTRDFAYSVEGLISGGYDQVVRDHLDKLFTFVRESDGLIPRVLDSDGSAGRVFHSLRKSAFGTKTIKRTKPITADLKAEYLGEHKTVAIDSNILVLRAALFYLEHTGDQEWFNSHLDSMVKIYRFYDQRKNAKGYIVQEKYGDWQDSVKRKGVTFLTNLHYWAVSRKLSNWDEFQINSPELEAIRRQLHADFFHPKFKVFRTHLKLKDQVSIDGNLFALSEKDFFDSEKARKELYLNLKEHSIWSRRQIPGSATFPNYPSGQIHHYHKLIGISNYHGKIMWSWLMGLSAKTAQDMGDSAEANRILDFISKIAIRDNLIAEIYNFNNKVNIRNTHFYKSERPFSWGAAFILDAVKTITEN